MRIVSHNVIKKLRDGLDLLGFKSVIMEPSKEILFIRGNGITTSFNFTKEDLEDGFGDKKLNVTLGEDSYKIKFTDGTEEFTVRQGIKKGKEFTIVELQTKDNEDRTYNVKYDTAVDRFDVAFETSKEHNPLFKEEVCFSTKQNEKENPSGISPFHENGLIAHGFISDGKYIERRLTCSFNWQQVSDEQEVESMDNSVIIYREDGRNYRSIPMDDITLFKMMLLKHPTNVATIDLVMRTMGTVFDNYRFGNFINSDSTPKLMSSQQFTLPFVMGSLYNKAIDAQVEECMFLFDRGNEQLSVERVRRLNGFPVKKAII